MLRSTNPSLPVGNLPNPWPPRSFSSSLLAPASPPPHTSLPSPSLPAPPVESGSGAAAGGARRERRGASLPVEPSPVERVASARRGAPGGADAVERVTVRGSGAAGGAWRDPLGHDPPAPAGGCFGSCSATNHPRSPMRTRSGTSTHPLPNPIAPFFVLLQSPPMAAPPQSRTSSLVLFSSFPSTSHATLPPTRLPSSSTPSSPPPLPALPRLQSSPSSSTSTTSLFMYVLAGGAPFWNKFTYRILPLDVVAGQAPSPLRKGEGSIPEMAQGRAAQLPPPTSPAAKIGLATSAGNSSSRTDDICYASQSFYRGILL
nr:vegetative cell wall protein gp1-like [Lolium perenne]XP_051178406.1 vegetative cell wall protein gp1-like [Lolium perenne]XP_051178407.1 vegetative cell wall protein gp1-like [Lolium perenne]XP_051178408.1 vegetative cell wall protein gp1-like [Lolium perenne]XP_051178409.1 vegetative cell wall protein gp1-like [Lolium perenne]XP_051178410.1 vegetative cell wall protein gp1-like [Lolium perenne]XP_051178411.1 vegetative cell wall protein gp1-like [Lolium perenne]XP_051178412.1 vegetative